MFSSFLMVGLTSMYDPSSVSQYSRFRYSIAYSGTNSSLLDRLQESDDFTVYSMELSPALEALKERKLAAVIFVPDTPPDAQDPVQITLYTLQNDLQATVVGVKLKTVFLGFESDLRAARASRITVQPIEVVFPPGSGTEGFYEFVYGLLIPLLVFMPAIISASLIIDLITEEYQHETLETLVSTPITFTEMVWGKILACEILVPAQAGVWLDPSRGKRDPDPEPGPHPHHRLRRVPHPDPPLGPDRAPLPGTDRRPVHLLHGPRGGDPPRRVGAGQPAQPHRAGIGGKHRPRDIRGHPPRLGRGSRPRVCHPPLCRADREARTGRPLNIFTYL